MLISKDIIIAGKHGRPICYDLYAPAGTGHKLIVFCHGFKGFKDWGPWNKMAEYIASKGFAFVKFNLSHNGVPPSDLLNFSDAEGFEKNTIGIELDDIELLIDHLLAVEDAPYDCSGYSMIGHSRGGPLAIFQALRDPRMKRLITWNSVDDLLGWAAKFDKRKWKKDGHVIIRNARTGQELPMGHELLQDLESNTAERDVLQAAARLNTRWKIFHAAEDETVPYSAAQALHKNCKHSELLILSETGHTFGGKHPFEESELPKALGYVVDLSLG